VGSESERLRMLHHQNSAAEVPGFHARTRIDDMIGKLINVRQQIRIPVPDGLDALLDDIDELVERAVDLALDPDAPELGEVGPPVPDGYELNEGRRWSNNYAVSASSALSYCSCGQMTCGR
jgi:hypothetical protein